MRPRSRSPDPCERRPHTGPRAHGHGQRELLQAPLSSECVRWGTLYPDTAKRARHQLPDWFLGTTSKHLQKVIVLCTPTLLILFRPSSSILSRSATVWRPVLRNGRGRRLACQTLLWKAEKLSPRTAAQALVLLAAGEALPESEESAQIASAHRHVGT